MNIEHTPTTKEETIDCFIKGFTWTVIYPIRYFLAGICMMLAGICYSIYHLFIAIANLCNNTRAAIKKVEKSL